MAGQKVSGGVEQRRILRYCCIPLGDIGTPLRPVEPTAQQRLMGRIEANLGIFIGLLPDCMPLLLYDYKLITCAELFDQTPQVLCVLTVEIK